MKHDRSLHYAGVLQRPVGEFRSEYACNGLRGEQLPVAQTHQPRSGYAEHFQFPQRQVARLDHKPLVLHVTYDKANLLDSVPRELPHQVLELLSEGAGIEAGGSGKMLTAAATWDRFVAIGDGRRHEEVRDAHRNLLADGVRDDAVGGKGQMRTMLFDGTHRYQHGRIVPFDQGGILGPAHIEQFDLRFHGYSRTSKRCTEAEFLIMSTCSAKWNWRPYNRSAHGCSPGA